MSSEYRWYGGTVERGHSAAAGGSAGTVKRREPAPTAGEQHGPLQNAWVRAPLNCSFLLTDIAGFGDRGRTDHDRWVIRNVLHRVLWESFRASHVPWAECLHEDRGDGFLTIIPPDIPTIAVVEPLIPVLAAKLSRYNRQVADPVRLRLRAALHVGPISSDPRGPYGQAVIHTARMLDAPTVKRALNERHADLAFVASTHVYETVIRHMAGLVDPSQYQHVRIRVKETDTTGWMYLAGGVVQPGRHAMRHRRG